MVQLSLLYLPPDGLWVFPLESQSRVLVPETVLFNKIDYWMISNTLPNEPSKPSCLVTQNRTHQTTNLCRLCEFIMIRITFGV